jgi:hypothetical protein
MQSDEPHCRKEYNYQFNVHNINYVEWHERETRAGVVKERLSLVYVAKAYMTAISVTEKRNLIWDLKYDYNFIILLFFRILLYYTLRVYHRAIALSGLWPVLLMCNP